MKEHFKEQLDAGAADDKVGDQFNVCFILQSPAGSKAAHTVKNNKVDDLNEDYKYVAHIGTVPILTPKD